MKEIRGHMGATMLRDLDLYNNPMNRVITIKPQSRLSSLISKMTPGKNSNDDRNEIYYCQNVFNPDRHKTKAEDLKTLQRFIEGPYSDYMHNLKLDHPPMDAIGTLARDNHWNIAESNLSRSTIDQLHFLYEGHVRPREPEAEEEEEEEEE
ncbi:uncharacterized protein L201_005629 [Kwoniella dendrophila CBS 6074]|uniref:Uncharacterized protein n=1 Tax=Kwoniella dendrophila CBS 6074 TaxID=1295534 RepID=A0AAX4JZA8_9TREE